VDNIDLQLLFRSSNPVGVLSRDKSEEERFARLVKLGFMTVKGRDARHSAPLPSLYCITESGRTILSKPSFVRLLVAVVALTLPAIAIAQRGGTTWKDLQFGMSESAARQKLAREFEFIPGAVKGDYTLKPDYELKTAGFTFQFTPGLAFGPEGHLKVVTLELDLPKMLATKGGLDAETIAKIGGLDARLLTGSGAPDIYTELIAKYGRPLSIKGECDHVTMKSLLPGSTEVPSCEAKWKAGGQLVSLVWFYSGRTSELNLVIEYRGQSDAL
jgi:hypothetical protein